MPWPALAGALTTAVHAAPPDRPVAEIVATFDGAVLDAADGFALVLEGRDAVVLDPHGTATARSTCGDGPVRGVLGDAGHVVLVARDGRTCLADRTLPGPRALDARPTPAGVVRLLPDGSLHGHRRDGQRAWTRRAPVGPGRRLRADPDPDVVVVVGDQGAARVDARTGRLLRAVFVAGTRDAACDGTHAWLGTASGQLRRFRLVDGREDTPPWLRAEAPDGAVRALVPHAGQLAVLRAPNDGAPAGRLQVLDLAREALSLDHALPDDPAADLAVVPHAAPALRWTTAARAAVMAWPDLGALPRPAPLREAPRHRPARRKDLLPAVTAPVTVEAPATPPHTPAGDGPRTARGPGRARAIGHADGTVALAGERDDGGRWQVVYGPVTALGWSGRAWLVAGDEGEGHVVRALAPAGDADAELPAPTWHPGTVAWLDGDPAGVRAGGPRHLALHDHAGGTLLAVRGDWRGAARGPGGVLHAEDAAGRLHALRVPERPLADAPRATAVHASPDGTRALTFEGDVPVLHDARTARVLQRLPALGAAPRAVAVRPGPGAPDLAAWRLDDVLDLVDLQRGEVVRSVAPGAPAGRGPWLAWSPSGRFAWTHVRAPAGNRLVAIDTRDGRIAAERAAADPPEGASGRWRALADGGWLDLDDPAAPVAEAGVRPLLDDAARGWRWVATPNGAVARDAAGAVTARLDLGAPAAALAEDARGTWRAAITDDGALAVLDTRHGTVVARRRLDAARCGVPAGLRFDDDATVLVVACDGATPVRLAWRLGRAFPEAPRAPGAVTPVGGLPTVAQSPDGTRLAVGLSDGTVRVVSLRDGAQEALWVGHAGPVTDVAWDGDLVASVSRDGSVRLRDAATGADRAAASTFGVPLRAVALRRAPDGGVEVEADGDDGFRRRWTVRDTVCVPRDRAPVPTDAPTARAPTPGVRPQPDGSVELARDDGPVPAAVLRGYSDGAWSVDHADGTRVMSTTLADGSARPLATP